MYDGTSSPLDAVKIEHAEWVLGAFIVARGPI